MENSSNQVLALLGPTNTGKTYVAIEKMLKYESGIFGFPLRLLAREVYDKCISKVGADKVALITGESKIIEIGPGKVLSGLIKRISDNFDIKTINKVSDLA